MMINKFMRIIIFNHSRHHGRLLHRNPIDSQLINVDSMSSYVVHS